MSKLFKATGSILAALTSAQALRTYRFMFDVLHGSALLAYLAALQLGKLAYHLGWEARTLLAWLSALIDTFVWQHQELNPIYLLDDWKPSPEASSAPDPWDAPPMMEALPALEMPVIACSSMDLPSAAPEVVVPRPKRGRSKGSKSKASSKAVKTSQSIA